MAFQETLALLLLLPLATVLASHHAPAPAPTHHHEHAATPLPHGHHHRAQAHAPALSPMPRGHHHHHHGPAHPPYAQGPATHLPAAHFPRSLVAVQGVVYCKPTCQYAGVDTLMGAVPLKGATVKLQCNNTKYPIEVKGTTDEHGYFFIQGPKTITNYGTHKCGTFLVSSSNTTCSVPADLHGGVHGGSLRAEKQFYISKDLFGLFTSGPFAFEPKCPHH